MYRNIVTEFWTDAKVEMLNCNEKLLALYLLTAPQGNLAGCYEVTFKRIELDTGIKASQVEKSMERLCELGIVSYSPDTSEVLVRNFGKYNWSKSPKTSSALEKQIERVENPQMRAELARAYEAKFMASYPYPIDTVSKGMDEVCIPPVSVSVSVPVSKEGIGVQGEGEKRPRFSPPSVHDVSAYAAERGCPGFNAARFVDHYEANGWMVGKNKMKDWKAAVRGWISRDGESKSGKAVSNGDFSAYRR